MKLKLPMNVGETAGDQTLITEYQQQRLICACGTTTCAGHLSAGVSTSQSGPRLIASTAKLMAHLRQGKRRAALFVSAVLNIPCRPSLTVKHQDIAIWALIPGGNLLRLSHRTGRLPSR